MLPGFAFHGSENKDLLFIPRSQELIPNSQIVIALSGRQHGSAFSSSHPCRFLIRCLFACVLLFFRVTLLEAKGLILLQPLSSTQLVVSQPHYKLAHPLSRHYH